jgi:hypothetical protein
MAPEDALLCLISGAIAQPKARRYIALMGSKKGQIKFLASLHHELDQVIKSGHSFKSRAHENLLQLPCFVFAPPKSFGVAYDHFCDAYRSLEITDSWLIVLADGSVGVYRPEARWDDELRIVAAR